MYTPTGSNVTPLGVKRRFTSEVKEETVSEEPQPVVKSESPSSTADSSSSKRKRKSRWGDEQQKVILPGLPTTLSTKNREQSEKYLLQVRIEELNRKLRTGDVVPRERSPSPEPIYGPDGKRVNTREARYRKKLEDDRHKLIEQALKTIPNFRPPIDYKRPTKTQEKVYIPAKEYPDVNFIGQLIGPRGNTLKNMEAESGAKISIRGRGSVKEGKSRTDAASNSAQEEELHCLVTADTEEKVKKAVKLIEKIIETSASVPEGQNELKRNQLRELAALNGTLRDDEQQTCLNCGAVGHRRFECPERQNITSSLTCHICGGGGHIARDCNQRNNPEAAYHARQKEAQLDSEYMNLMAELGESVDHDSRGAGGAPWQQGRSNAAAPPWQQQRAGGAAPPWSSSGGSYGAPPPGVSSSAPWQQSAGYYPDQQSQQGYYNSYGGYDASYQGSYDGYYDQSQAAPPPPGSSAPWQQQQNPPPPPGSSSAPWQQQAPPPPPGGDQGQNPWSSMPPPPPSSDAPPPPPSDSTLPPPPPPGTT